MSSPTKRLAEWALELGFGCVLDGDRTPIVLIETAAGEYHFIDLKSADGHVNDHLRDTGRQLIAKAVSRAKLYAFAWDGYVTSAKQDAVIVEVGERGAKEGFLYVQVYKSGPRAKRIKKVGEPIVLGSVPQLLRVARKSPTKRTAAQSSSKSAAKVKARRTSK